MHRWMKMSMKERLFGAVSDEDDKEEVGSCDEDYYDEDSGTFQPIQNVNALQVLIDKELCYSDKIVDYYSIGHVFDTDL